MPDRGVRLWRAAGFRTSGDVVWMARCPASYVTPFTEDMLTWYLWLNEWHKTPFDFGATPEELDHRYALAMAVLRREGARVEKEEMERVRKESGR